MSTCAFFNLPGAIGHLNPTVPLVKNLVQRGERVIYYAGEEAKAQITSAGAEFRSCQELLNYSHDDPKIADNVILTAQALLSATEKGVGPLSVSLKNDHVDYVLYDGQCPWGKFIAAHLKVPGICLNSTIISSPYLMLGDTIMAKEIFKILIRVGKLVPMIQRIKKLAQRENFPYKGFWYHVFDLLANRGDLNIVFLPACMQPYHRLLGKSYRFVGASVPELRSWAGPDISYPAADRALIYISLGTLHNAQPGFYRTCLSMLENEPFDVIMSVGERINIENLGSIPANCAVYSKVPQLDVLKHADLFISHGGSNSINESMLHGVPMLIVPMQLEQAFNARQLKRMNAALFIPMHRVTATHLRHSIYKILGSKRFAEAANVIGQQIKVAGGTVRAADEIIDLIEQQGIATNKHKLHSHIA